MTINDNKSNQNRKRDIQYLGTSELVELRDIDMAKIALREKLNSMLRFGRLVLKTDEAKPRYDIITKNGIGRLTRADGSIIREFALDSLVSEGKQVRLALVAYKRLLQERGAIAGERDNSRLNILVNTQGNEVVLSSYDTRSGRHIQRYELTREIEIKELGLILNALPKRVAEAAELGAQIEANLRQRLEQAREAGDVGLQTTLEAHGISYGVFKLVPVRSNGQNPKPAAGKGFNQKRQTKKSDKRNSKGARVGSIQGAILVTMFEQLRKKKLVR